MKKVVICASSTLQKESEKYKQKLEESGYKVVLYPKEIEQDISTTYPKIFKEHYQAITKANIIFVLNLEKNGIQNYIGPSVFAEIAFAIGLNSSLKKNIEIYLLNPLPQNLPYSKELKLWKKMGWIKQWLIDLETLNIV